MTKWFLSLLLFAVAFDANAKSITSVDITQATVKGIKNCLHYQFPPKRFCIWLSPESGRTLTPVLDHYLPDLVVTVFRNQEDNPWSEARTLLDKPSHAIQQGFINKVGNSNHSFLDEHAQEVMFKEADVIGNPGLAVIPSYIGEVILSSTSVPFKPYFQSMVDSALWRGLMPQALPEEVAAVALNVIHHVGTGINDWGGIYPHEGTIVANDDAKASLVIAQRAADIVTNPHIYGHVHQSLENSCGENCDASPIVENSKDTLFQLIYPIVDDDCSMLGSEKSYNEKMLNDEGAYAWIVWRHYQGCPEGDGKLIGVTP